MIGLGLILCSFILFCWQAYEFLRFNAWPPISIITVLELMGVGWASNPTDWLGLYNLFEAIPMSVTLFAIGVFFIVISYLDSYEH